jgi:hypothetical protein
MRAITHNTNGIGDCASKGHDECSGRVITEWALYCDESGNTGKNFGDRSQPLYVECGWYVRHEDGPALMRRVESLESSHGYQRTEIKGARLLRSRPGRAFLHKLTESMQQTAVPYFYLVEKRYAICAKLVESLFDPAYNPAVPTEETWDPDFRQELAQHFYDGSEELIYQFGVAYREKNSVAVCENARNWLAYFQSNPVGDHAERIAAVLPNLDREMQGEFQALSSSPTGYDALNMPIWVMLFQDMEHHFAEPCDLIHDRIDVFQDCFEHTYNTFRGGRNSSIVMKDGRQLTSGLQKVVSLSFADSETQPLIRAADCLAAATREFAWRAFTDQSIDSNLFRAAYPTIGALMCWVLSHMHPALGPFPQLGTVMASSQFAAKLFARTEREEKLHRDSVQSS